tara:strand:+ start:2990 stop:3139 length:150 start_codon:yes stop_codon:yes gene_type:complete
MAFEFVPTKFAAGAELRGVNFAEPLGEKLLATLNRALGNGHWYIVTERT